MPRIVIFLAVVISIVGGVHFYFWWRLVRDTQMPAPFRVWATAAIMALAISLPLTMLVSRRLPRDVASVLAWPAFTWLGLMFLLFVALLVLDIVRMALGIGARVGGAPLDPARRTALARVLGGVATGGAAIVGALAVRKAVRELRIKEVEIPVAKLPPASAGLTIAQITDLHVGPTIGRAFVEDVVRRTNALSPDVIAITGDLVDGSVEELRDGVAPLAHLRARHGVYFVTGNHEYFSGVGPWVAHLASLGIRVLRNERVSIGEGDAAFDLAGVDDYGARRFGQGPDLAKALAGRDDSRALVLLAHQPRAVAEAARMGVGLQLSGHTHGGQLWPFAYFVKLQTPYVAGLYQHEGTRLYVSPGTGYWGPPMRLGTTAEITRIKLAVG